MKFSRKYLSTKKRSRISEKQAAKFLNGRLQPASGALRTSLLKGDIVTDRFLVDDKTTDNASYGITIKLWRKLAAEAGDMGKRAMLRLNFIKGPTLYVIDELSLAEFLESTPCTSSSNSPMPVRRSSRK